MIRVEAARRSKARSCGNCRRDVSGRWADDGGVDVRKDAPGLENRYEFSDPSESLEVVALRDVSDAEW